MMLAKDYALTAAVADGKPVAWHDMIPDPFTCSTSDQLQLFQNVQSCCNTVDSLPGLETELLLDARGLQQLELTGAIDGTSQEKFEFDTPPVFEDFFEEQEGIDGYQQVEVCCDVTVGDVSDVMQPPAGFSPAVKKYLQGRMPAPQRSRYQQILAREEESLDGQPPACLDSGRVTSSSKPAGQFGRP